MKGLRNMAVAGSLALLSACTTLGPDYQPPDDTWLAQWNASLYGVVNGDPAGESVDLRFWWRIFDDPALEQLIAAAREQNPSLRIAGLRVLESRALLAARCIPRCSSSVAP